MTSPPGATPPAGTPHALARLGATVTALVSVLAGKAMIASGLRRAPEGWRRTVGVLLRSEPTRFALSAFGLRIPGTETREAGSPPLDSRIAEGLLSFLTSESDAHYDLDWHAWVTTRQRTRWVDVVLLRFTAAGSLESIEPHLSPVQPDALAAAQRAQVQRAIVDAYNETRQLPEVRRTMALRAAVESRAGSPAQATAYARRLLSACCLSLETIDMANAAERFSPPHFAARRTLGFGYLSVVARPDAAERRVDVWMSAHHVGLDGVPLQEMLSRLEQAWGIADPVLFPSASSGQVFTGPHVVSAPGERAVHHALTFVDFSPVMALRQALNARYAEAVGGEVTFGALLAWLLNREPEFAGIRIASTVDIPASGGYERDVDVVPLRPSDFVNGNGPWDGLVEFAREFNRLVQASRTRTSPLRREMQTAGLLPAWAHSHVVRANPAALDDTFGSMCITIIRDAKVFIAPMTDLGLGHGFFAIGSARLATADGRSVASVSIKGDAGSIDGYPAVLQRVVDRCASLRPM